jgi:hypothetical protein
MLYTIISACNNTYQYKSEKNFYAKKIGRVYNLKYNHV